MLRTLSAGALVMAASVAWPAQRTVTLTVENMTCAACPVVVRAAIKQVPGVKDAKIDLRTKTAVVLFDDDLATAAKIAEASRLAGFPAKLKD